VGLGLDPRSAYFVFGYRVQTDLEIVTPERTVCLMLSHHGELDVQFASAVVLETFVAGMLAEGYPLPDDERGMQ